MSRDGVPHVELQCEAHIYPDGTVGMHDVEFAVYPDEVVAVIGANGAGKSTLLEHLNGTLAPHVGELVIDGTTITEANKALAREEVGFVFQDADTQLVAPTVLDDVMFGLRNYGIPSDQAKERAREALMTVDASHLEDRIPHYLSGGEKRLVGLAGVLVLEPSVVVFDEPLAGLDPSRSRLVADRIRRIHEEGVSVVLSTHDLEFAAEVADRIYVMADGDIIGCGPPKEIFYDDSLLDASNLYPPTAVRVARKGGFDTTSRPITEAELLVLLTNAAPGSDDIRSASVEGNKHE